MLSQSVAEHGIEKVLKRLSEIILFCMTTILVKRYHEKAKVVKCVIGLSEGRQNVRGESPTTFHNFYLKIVTFVTFIFEKIICFLD